LLNRPLWWGLVSIGAIALSLGQAGILTGDIFNPGGWPLLLRFLRAAFQPDLSPDFLRLTLEATLTTLAYAVCGTFLSVIFGTIAGIFASEVWWRAILRRSPGGCWWAFRALLAVPRAVHEILWGLLFVNIWGLDPLAAILAIAIGFGAVVAKVFSEILDETPRQSLLALLNSGVSPATAFLYTLIPQAFLNLLSYSFYRFECSIRSAAVLGVIGAGGLGHEMFLSLQSLRYQQLWTFFYALLLLNGTVDFVSAWYRDRLGCANRLDLNQGGGKSVGQTRRNLRLGNGFKMRSLGWVRDPFNFQFPTPLQLASAAIAVLVPVCFWVVHPDWSQLRSPKLWQFCQDAFHHLSQRQWEGIPFSQLLQLSGQTLSMSVLAIAFAGIGGILLSFPAARHPNKPSFLFLPTRLFLLLCRAIPAPIWALIVLFLFFPGILPGAIALGLHNLGILGRLMAEGVENLPQPPLTALSAAGAPPGSVFIYGILPTILPRFLAYILYRWEVCLRETIVVGLVGAGGLGRLLREQLSSFDAGGILATLTCLALLTFAVDRISDILRRSLR